MYSIPMDCDVSVCRLCLSSDEKAFEIFGEKGVLLDVASILSKHFWFEVTKEDSLPQIICTECWLRVNNFHELYLNVERKYKHFYENFQQSNTPVSSGNSGSGNNNESKMVKIKKETEHIDQTISLNSDSEYDNKLNVKLLNESGKNIDDDEDEEGDDDDDEEDDDDDNEDEAEEITVKNNVKNVNKHNKTVDSDDDVDDFIPNETSDLDSDDDKPLKITLKTGRITRKRNTTSATSSTTTVNKKKLETTDKKPRFDSNKDNETIKKYFNMTCDLCTAEFDNFLHAKKHHRRCHNQTGYLNCCDKKFYKLYRVMQHCIWHENPEAFKCSECSKCYLDGVGLRDHMDNVHAPAEMRIFSCDICPKSFLRRHMLTTHKRLTHVTEEDKKFECDICGQKFIIQPFLQAHIKKVHENADSRICDICAKFFKCSKSYEIHYLCVHSDVQQKVQCELCGKWLKHKESLKEHKRRHVAASEKCEFCGRTCSNKKALRAHIRSTHTAPTFLCTVCNKLFKKRQTLTEHMAIHSGRTDLYSCSFCTKTFRSSANMYAHRKKAHPKEYEENRNCGNKYGNSV